MPGGLDAFCPDRVAITTDADDRPLPGTGGLGLCRPRAVIVRLRVHRNALPAGDVSAAVPAEDPGGLPLRHAGGRHGGAGFGVPVVVRIRLGISRFKRFAVDAVPPFNAVLHTGGGLHGLPLAEHVDGLFGIRLSRDDGAAVRAEISLCPAGGSQRHPVGMRRAVRHALDGASVVLRYVGRRIDQDQQHAVPLGQPVDPAARLIPAEVRRVHEGVLPCLHVVGTDLVRCGIQQFLSHGSQPGIVFWVIRHAVRQRPEAVDGRQRPDPAGRGVKAFQVRVALVREISGVGIGAAVRVVQLPADQLDLAAEGFPVAALVDGGGRFIGEIRRVAVPRGKGGKGLQKMVVVDPPDRVLRGVVPRDVDEIGGIAVDPHQVPAVVDGFGGDIIVFDPQLVQQPAVSHGIPLTHAGVQRQRPVSAVGFVGNGILLIIPVIVFAPRRQPVMEDQALLRLRQSVVVPHAVQQLYRGVFAGGSHGKEGLLIVFIVIAKIQRCQEGARIAAGVTVRELTAGPEQNRFIEQKVFEILQIRVVLSRIGDAEPRQIRFVPVGGHRVPDGGKHAVPIYGGADILRDQDGGLVPDRLHGHDGFRVRAALPRRERGENSRHAERQRQENSQYFFHMISLSVRSIGFLSQVFADVFDLRNRKLKQSRE